MQVHGDNLQQKETTEAKFADTGSRRFLREIRKQYEVWRKANRSALDWVIDQYRMTRDEKGNIANDPNRMDDEQYIVRLIGRVVAVSLETMKVVKSLPPLEK